MNNPISIRAADVREGDIMNFKSHPRAYDRVTRVRVLDNGYVQINFFTMPHGYYTVKHAEEGVAVWRGAV